MTGFNSQKINNDPTPLYKVRMIERNGNTAEWAMRSDSKAVAIESAIKLYPSFDVHTVGVIYNRPEFDNRPNPFLVLFRLIDQARMCSTRPETAVLVLHHLDDPESTIGQDDDHEGATEEHLEHARKVLRRLTVL